MAAALQSLGWAVATGGATAAVRGVMVSFYNAQLVAEAEALGVSPRDRRIEKLVDARTNRAFTTGVLSGLSAIGWYWLLDRTVGRFTASSARFPWLRRARILKPLPLLACVLLEAGATAGSVVVASNTDGSLGAARTALTACLVTGKSFVPTEHPSSVFTRQPAAAAATTYFAAASDGVEEMRLGQWARVGTAVQLLGSVVLYGLVPFAWRVPLGAALSAVAWSPAEDGSDAEALVNIVEAFAGDGAEESERRELALAVVEGLTMRAIRTVSLEALRPAVGPDADGSSLADDDKIAVLALALETAVGVAVQRLRREGRAKVRRNEASEELVAALRASDAADSSSSIVARVGCAVLLAEAMPGEAAGIVPGERGGLVVERDGSGVGFEWAALEGLVRWVAKPGSVDVADLQEVVGSDDDIVLQAVQLALEVACEAMEGEEGTPWGARVLEAGRLRVTGSDEEQSDPLLLAVGGQGALDAVATERDDLSLGWQQQHLQRSISRVPDASSLGRR